jgi:hypothetical protein
MSERDAGTVIPLVLLSLLLAGLVGTAGTAASAAFLAQRDLAGVCDGAALAAAAAVDRGAIDDETLPLDPSAVRAAADRYRRRAGKPGLALRARTDGRTVTVECRRTVRIPFGAVLGKAGGLERAAVARARPAVLPAGRSTVHLRQTQWTVPARVLARA